MALIDRLRRRGRPPHEPDRQTQIWPTLFQIGRGQNDHKRPTYKPTPRNLRYFAKTPFARRAINTIKNPIAQLEWEVVPVDEDRKIDGELQRQIDVATYCLNNPNEDDSFRSFVEQLVEDILCGAGAAEVEISGDERRPLWMWPVDGLSIQIFPGWTGERNEARYLQSIGYSTIGLTDRGVLLSDDELMYIRPNQTTHNPFGTGPLEIAFMSISRQLGVAQYAGKVSANQRPNIALNLGEGVSAEQVSAFRNYWRNDVEGQGQMPIISGLGADSILLHPEGDAALYLGYQEWLLMEIAASFDISPMNLGKDADVNRNQGEVNEDRDWDQAIKPMAHLVQEHLTRFAIQRRLGFTQIRFRFVGLDREDEEATAKIFEIYYKNNVLVPNEQRARLGLEPSENEFADKTYTETQVAIQAARGMAANLDKDLPGGGSPAPKTAKPKPSKKEK